METVLYSIFVRHTRKKARATTNTNVHDVSIIFNHVFTCIYTRIVVVSNM